MTDVTPLVEAYLLIEQPRQRIGHWSAALAALDSRAAPPLASVIAYYDPTCDQALLRLRYDELALGPRRLDYVVEVALLAEIGMIQPAALSAGERQRVLSDRLARCTYQVDDARGAVAALAELVKRLRAVRTARSVHREPRGDTQDPLPLVTARGTRDDVSKAAKAAATARELEKVTEAMPPLARIQPAHELATPALFRRPATPHRHVVPRSSRAKTLVADARADLDDELSPPPARRPHASRPAFARSSSPQFPVDDGAPATIYARYLRSGKWIPIRVGALSLKGAALMTGALPRLHDHVDVALAYGGHRALVRGAVGKVSTMREAAATGAATFSVAFELDVASRRQLTELLTAARAAKVTIKPPPARGAQRFPVEWPLSLGAIRGDALDVSASGLFVRSAPLELGTALDVALADEAGAPICGRARVVRELGDLDAQACGLAPGYGLAFEQMGDADRARWHAFIGRIERRTEKRVLVGATQARLAELQSALAGAGYAVIGGTDPGALVQLANADTRPVDAALIDGTWLGAGSASWVENLFSARAVPCVTVNGDVRKARTAVDRLLKVAS